MKNKIRYELNALKSEISILQKQKEDLIAWILQQKVPAEMDIVLFPDFRGELGQRVSNLIVAYITANQTKFGVIKKPFFEVKK